jgi:hypothetical protein
MESQLRLKEGKFFTSLQFVHRQNSAFEHEDNASGQSIAKVRASPRSSLRSHRCFNLTFALFIED